MPLKATVGAPCNQALFILVTRSLICLTFTGIVLSFCGFGLWVTSKDWDSAPRRIARFRANEVIICYISGFKSLLRPFECFHAGLENFQNRLEPRRNGFERDPDGFERLRGAWEGPRRALEQALDSLVSISGKNATLTRNRHRRYDC